jgi:hypothetical protein
MKPAEKEEPIRDAQGDAASKEEGKGAEFDSSKLRENDSAQSNANGGLHSSVDIPTDPVQRTQTAGSEADSETNGTSSAIANAIIRAKRSNSICGDASASFIAGRRGSVEKRGSDTVGDAAIVEKLSNIPIHVRGRAEAWEIPRSQLQLSTKLGAGAGSVVFKCRWRGLDCAAKLLSDRNARDTGVYQEMVNEISIISHLRHPNLVLFLGACTVGSEPLVILSEYMAGGSLEDRFKAIASGSAHRSVNFRPGPIRPAVVSPAPLTSGSGGRHLRRRVCRTCASRSVVSRVVRRARTVEVETAA